MSIRDQFARTTCACAACVQCCKEQPGPLAPGDAEPIAAHLGLTVAQLAECYLWASPGAVVKDGRTARVFRIGTITPRLEAGRCIFLDTADRCRVHGVAPFGCSHADTHMPHDEWHRRAVVLYRAVATDSDYQALRATLPQATSWKPRG